MPEIILPHDMNISPQETAYWCGPGSAQIVLTGRALFKPESQLAKEIGTTVNGTDHISQITRVLNQYLGKDAYAIRDMRQDPPTRDQIELLWRDVHFSINSGYGVVANIISPESNRPIGTRGSRSPNYGRGTVYHYVAIMGVYDGPDGRHFLVDDPGFPPHRYWVSLENMANLIAGKGYTMFLDRKPSPMPTPTPIPGSVPVARTVIDTAQGYPSPDEIRAAGHGGIMLYVSDPRPGTSFPGKKLTPDIFRMYANANIPAAPVWQYGKPAPSSAPSDFTRGFAGGVEDAQKARKRWVDCGGSVWTPIFFAVDENISETTWFAQAREYFRGVNSVLGVEWTGIYGSKRVVGWAIRDGVIGQRDGKFWAWQPSNWDGATPDPRIVLFQRIIDTQSKPGPLVGGIHVDVNDTLASDWGQTGIDRKPADVPAPQPVPVKESPVYYPLTLHNLVDNSPNQSSRNGAIVRLGVIHTQQGNGTADSLMGYLKNPNSGVSYHYVVDNNKCIRLVPTNRASWSVLDANPYTINLCFAGSFVEWTRQQWLDNMGKGIEMAAAVLVADAREYGYDPRTISWAELASGRKGITDHWGITGGLRIGNHTDVGKNFPWDVFAAHVDSYAKNLVVPGAAPVKTAIQAEYDENPWLGKELFEGERDTRGNAGKFKHYENGSIYWRSDIGAKTLSKHIFEEWAKRDYETGELGYPTGDATILPVGSKRGEGTGEVQGFERGTIYRKYGAERGYHVHGLIYAHWRRAGYENGTYGWPKSDELEIGRGKYQEFEGGNIFFPNNQTIGFKNVGGADMPIPDVPEKP